MKIALCIKQVPDTTDIKWTDSNTIQREGVESIINPCDVYATELALDLKNELKNTQITVFTMGPAQAESMLRKVLALGCDNAVLVSDRKFAGADTYSTGLTLSRAIRTVLPDFDLIICGQFAIDGDTAQTGPIIANFLDIPQVTYVKNVMSVNERELVLVREMEDGQEVVSAKYPALVCVINQDFEPRRVTIDGVISASKKDVKIYGMADIGLDAERVGIKGSPTFVSKAFRNVSSHEAKKYFLSSEESASLIVGQLNKMGVFVNGK